MTDLLNVKNLSVTYKTRRGNLCAVDKLSLTLDKGRSLGLVGESGSGKSTVGAAIIGLLPDNAIVQGQIHFNGMELLTADGPTLQQIRWKRIAMIFQAAMNALNPIRRVSDQIMEAIRIHEPETDPAEARQRVEALYDMVGIPRQRYDDYPHQYSGGMRQRAIIAMALACRPNIIIADEPTTALDVIVQDQILKTIGKLQKELGIGILFVSHDISVVADVCHDIAVMYGGKIVESGTRQEVFDTPGHPYTQALLGAHITLTNDRPAPETIAGDPPDLIDPDDACRFYDRCRFAHTRCRLDTPEWQQLSTTHKVLCWCKP